MINAFSNITHDKNCNDCKDKATWQIAAYNYKLDDTVILYLCDEHKLDYH